MKAGWAIGARAAHAYFREAEREPAQGRRSSGAGKHREEAVEAAEGGPGQEAVEDSGEEEWPGGVRRRNSSGSGGRPRLDDKHATSSSGSSTPRTSTPGAEESRGRGRSSSRASARPSARQRSESRDPGAAMGPGPGSKGRSFKSSSVSGPSAGRNGRRATVVLKKWKRGKPLPRSSTAEQAEGQGREEAEAWTQAEARVEAQAEAAEAEGLPRTASAGDDFTFEPRSTGLAEGRQPVRTVSSGEVEEEAREGRAGKEEAAVEAEGARIGMLIREFVQKQRAKELELVAHRLEATGELSSAEGLQHVGLGQGALGKGGINAKNGQEAEEEAREEKCNRTYPTSQHGEHGTDARATDQIPQRRIPYSAPSKGPRQKADANAASARPVAPALGARDRLRSPSLRKTAFLLSAMHLSSPSQGQSGAHAQPGREHRPGPAERASASGGAAGDKKEEGATRAGVHRSVSSTSDTSVAGIGGSTHGMVGEREDTMLGGVSPGSPVSNSSSPLRTAQAVRRASAGYSTGAPTGGSSASVIGRVMGSTHSEAAPSAILPPSWHLPKSRSTVASEPQRSPARAEEPARFMRRAATDGKRIPSVAKGQPAPMVGSAPPLQPGLGRSSESGGAQVARGFSKKKHKGAAAEAPAKALAGRAAAVAAAQGRGHNSSGQDGSQQRQRGEQHKESKVESGTHRASTGSKDTNPEGSMKSRSSSSSSSSSSNGTKQVQNRGGAGGLAKASAMAPHAGQTTSVSRLHRASSDGAVLQGVLEEGEEDGQWQEAPEQGGRMRPAAPSTSTEARSPVFEPVPAAPGVAADSAFPLVGADTKPGEGPLRCDSMHAEDSNRSSNTSSSGRSSTSASTNSSDPILERFELDDLRQATQNFHSRYLLGAGSFGRVYAGCLEGWASPGTSGGPPPPACSASHQSGAVSPALSSPSLQPTIHSLTASPMRAPPLGPAAAPPQAPSSSPQLPSTTAAGAQVLVAGAGVRSHAEDDARSGATSGAALGAEGGAGPSADSGRLIAIKVLSSRRQGMDEWLNELSMARFTADHPNVVRLRGYCFDEGFSMLVYDLCTRGNLSDYIMPGDLLSSGAQLQHGDMARPKEGGEADREKHMGQATEGERTCEQESSIEGQSDPLLAHLHVSHAPLTWAQRLHVMRGVVAGLAHLHSHNIIHSDLKLANILLDQETHFTVQDLNAKLSDYGLAKQVGSGKEGYLVTQKVMGTLGYLDPAYYRTGQLRQDSDVYSLGVVLLQLLTGRPAHDFEEGRPLVMLLRPYITLALSLRDQEVQAGGGAHGSLWGSQGPELEQTNMAPAPLAPKMAALKRQLDRIMDSTLLGHYSVLSALRVLQIAARCVAMEGQARPDIRSIHDQLALLS